MKTLAKQIVKAASIIVVGIPALAELMARRIAGRDVFFATHSQILSLVPGKLGWYLRNAYYHVTLVRCPLNCCINFGVLFTHSEAGLGNRVYVGARCTIGMATIGDDTMLADGVQLISGKHQHGTSGALPFQQQERKFDQISVGPNCWIGTSAIVMSDVGANCIVGAGSVVTKPIASNTVAAGVPARVIRSTMPQTMETQDKAAL